MRSYAPRQTPVPNNPIIYTEKDMYRYTDTHKSTAPPSPPLTLASAKSLTGTPPNVVPQYQGISSTQHPSHPPICPANFAPSRPPMRLVTDRNTTHCCTTTPTAPTSQPRIYPPTISSTRLPIEPIIHPVSQPPHPFALPHSHPPVRLSP